MVKRYLVCVCVCVCERERERERELFRIQTVTHSRYVILSNNEN